MMKNNYFCFDSEALSHSWKTSCNVALYSTAYLLNPMIVHFICLTISFLIF